MWIKNFQCYTPVSQSSDFHTWNKARRLHTNRSLFVLQTSYWKILENYISKSGKEKVKAPSRNSSNNSMVKEKLLTRKQFSRNKENYFKHDIGEQLEKGSLERFGELETFWAQCLWQGTQMTKLSLFSSPNLVLLLVLCGTPSLSPRGYCGLEIISGIRTTRSRVQLLQ